MGDPLNVGKPSNIQADSLVSIDNTSTVDKKVQSVAKSITKKNLSEKKLELHKIIDISMAIEKGRGISPLVILVKTFFLKLSVFIRTVDGLGKEYERLTEHRLNVNSNILSSIVDASTEEGECPKSVVMEYMLQNIDDNEANKELRGRFEKCKQMCHVIEKLQSNKNIKTIDDKAITTVVDTIKTQIDGLENKGIMLIPGGWYDKSDIFHDALYEIKKVDENYTVRFISVDASVEADFSAIKKGVDTTLYTPFKEFKDVTTSKLKSSVERLILMQLPPSLRNPKSSKSLLSNAWGTLQRMMVGENDHKSDDSVNVQDPIDIMKYEYGKTVHDEQSDVKEKLYSRSTSARTMKTYMRLINKDNKDASLELEMKTFLEIVGQSEDLLSNEKFRNIVHDSALKLISGSTETFQINNKELITRFAKIIETVGKKSNNNSISKTINKNDFVGNVVDTTISLPAPIQLNTFVPIEIKHADPIEFKNNLFALDSYKENLKSSMEQCEKLYDDGNFDLLERYVAHIASQIPVPSDTNEFWKSIAKDDCSALSKNMFELNRYIFECNRFATRNFIPKEIVLTTATLFAASDKLLTILNLDDLNGKHFDASILLKTLSADTYFRGSSKQDLDRITELTSYFKTFKGKCIALDGRDSLLEQNKNTDESIYADADFIGAFIANAGFDEKKDDYIKSFNNLISGECFNEKKIDDKILQMRDMRIMSIAIAQNNMCFVSQDKAEGVRIALQVGKDIGYAFDKISTNELWRRTFNISRNNIVTKLRTQLAVKNSKRGHTELKYSDKAEDMSIAGTNITYAAGAFAKRKRIFPEEEIYKAGGRLIRDDVDRNIVHFNISEKNSTDGMQLTQHSVIKTSATEEENLLRNIQTGSKRLENTFAEFSRNPELMDDTSYQRLFELNMFQEGALASTIKNNPNFLNSLSDFVNNNFNIAMSSENIERALFLAGMGSIIADFRPEGDDYKAIDSKGQYSKLLGNTNLTQSERRAIITQKIALHQMSHKPFKEDDYSQVVEAFILKNNVISGSKYSNQSYDYAVETAYRSIESKIKDNDKYFNNILEQYKNIFGENATIDKSTGLIAASGIVTTTLPEEIAQNSNLKPFIKNLKNSKYTISHYTSKTTAKIIDLFKPVDSVDIRIIREEGKPLVIQKEIDGKWFEVVSSGVGSTTNLTLPSKLESLACNKILMRDIYKPESMLIFNKEEYKNPEYKINLKKFQGQWKVDEIKRTSDSCIMSTPDAATVSKFPEIFGVDSPENSIMWTRNNSIHEISFPRLTTASGSTISYKITDDNGSIKITTDDSSELLLSNSDMEIFPKSFDDYHLIKNGNGNKQVLIPIKKLVIPGAKDHQEKERIAQWSRRAQLDHSEQYIEPRKVATIDIDSFGKINNDKGTSLYMAYIYLAHKQYDKAMELLKKSDTSLQLASEYLQVFKWIKEWPDTTAEGIAFKLHSALSYGKYNTRQGIIKSNIDTLQDAEYLMNLKAKYDETSSGIEKGLCLENEDIKSYESAVKSTLLILTEIKKNDEDIKINPTASNIKLVKLPTDQERDALIRSIKVKETNDKVLPKKLPIAADNLLISSFKIIYKKLCEYYSCNNEGNVIKDSNKKEEDVKELKQWIADAVPTEPSAIVAKSYLLMLIALIEKGYESTILLVLPKGINEDKENIDTPKLDQVRSCYKTYIIGDNVIKERDLKASNLKQRDDDAILQDSLEGEFISEEEDDINDIKDSKKDSKSPEDTLQRLEEEGKLTQLAKNRRVGALRKKSQDVEAELPEVIEDKQVIDTKSKFSPINVLGDGIAVNFKEEEVKESDSQSIDIDKILLNFEKPASSQRLAKCYCDDTKAFVGKSKSKTYKLEENITIDKLKDIIDSKKFEIIANRKSAESEIIKTIFPDKSDLKSLIVPTITTVPKRLIGLFVDNKINEESLKNLFGVDINGDQIKDLESNIKKYMDMSIQERLITTSYSAISATKPNINEIYTQLTTKRNYNVNAPESRELLSIEFVNGFILREEQINTIESMLNNPNTIKQLAMGGGKSSVLLPFILRKMANGSNMAIGVIPEWLYGAVSQDLDTNCRELFGQDVIRFEFDRDVDADEEWLLRNYTTLADAVINKSAVITTKTSMLSFRDKFIDLMNERSIVPESQHKVIDTKLNIIAKTLELFKARGSVIADEVDAILDVRHELNYSIGDPSRIDVQKTSVGISIFRKIQKWGDSKDDDLQKFSIAIQNNTQATLTNGDKVAIQKQLAKEIFTELNVTDLGEDLFVNYISGLALAADAELIEKFLNSLNKNVKTKIVYARQYISTTLATTLTRTCDVHYGRAEGGSQTIPFKASNTPSDAEFGEEFERIAYCAQDYLQHGITSSQAKSFIDNIRKQIDGELRAAMLNGNAISIEQTVTYKAFKESYPAIDIIKTSKDEGALKVFMDKINGDKNKSLDFLENWVMPNIMISTKQVSSNSFDFCDMFKNFRGFTGTTWNLDTFHPGLKTEGAKTEGTDGKSIAFLLSNKPKITIKKIDSSDPKSFIDAEFTKQYDSLIDAGAYLHGIPNSEVSEHIIDIALEGRKNAVFVDDSNEKVIRNGKTNTISPLSSSKGITSKERISYYDQAHTIGTDIAHDKDAKALVTISEKMYIKDLLQSIWRMRKLGQGQKIDFFISDEVASLIKAFCGKTEGIEVEDIIKFCIHNQAEREADDNLRAQQQQLQGRIPNAMLQELIALHKDSSSEAPEVFEKYSEFLIKQPGADIDSLARINSKIDSTTFLDNLKESLKATYKTIDVSNDIVKKAIENNDKHKILGGDKLPDKVDDAPPGDKDSQVQTQRQQQQQQQISVETLNKRKPIDKSEEWVRWLKSDREYVKNKPDNSLKGFWIAINGEKKVGGMERISTALKGFDDSIVCSSNFAVANTSKTEQKPLHARILGENRIPVHQVVIIQDCGTKEMRAVCVDTLDYEKIISDIKNSEGYKMAVYDVRVPFENCILKSSEQGNGTLWDADDMKTVQQLLVQTKLFAGQFGGYNKGELAVIKSWLSEKNTDIASIRKNFEQYLIRPSQLNNYNNSQLKTLFDELIKH